MVILLMGVAGSGKTTVGRRLAEDLGWPFFDGDDFHPPENVAKMAQGLPLTNADRAPWLDALRALIDEVVGQGRSAVIACSALKQAYRRRLLHNHAAARLVYLKGDYALIRRRMRRRRGHFFDPDLLRSQFDTLEEPTEGVTVDVAAPPAQIVRQIRAALRL